MGDMNFDSDVTFKESAEARINKYNKKAPIESVLFFSSS